MGARVQVVVMVAVVAAAAAQHVSPTPPAPRGQPSPWRGVPVMVGLVNDCRDTAGGKAAQVLENSLDDLMPCIKMEELQAEAQRSFLANGVKGAINTVCGQKDQLLQCYDPVHDAMKQCQKDWEKVIEAVQETNQRSVDFICEHGDDIAKIFGSQEQIQCGQRMFERAVGCNPFSSQNVEEIQNFLNSTEQMCNKIDEVTDCINGITGNCKNSGSLQLFNDMKKEVLDEGVCSAAASLAGAGTLLKPLVLLLLALTVTRFLPL